MKSQKLLYPILSAAIAGLVSAAQAYDIPAKKLECKKLSACYGVNACSGKGQCSSATHECGGQNSCKGAGWLAMPEEACLALKGGSLTPTEASQKKG